jgi:hypothetical protein
MRKMQLQLESLDVASFPTTPAVEAQRGTVRAHYTNWYEATCGGVSCQYVCRTRYDTPCV